MKSRMLLVVAVAVILIGSPALAEKRVLILSIDGCRPDALQVANTPRIDALAAAGSASFDARNVMDYGDSGANYSSMLTGVDWPKHGVTSNSVGGDGHFAGNQFNLWPHMFSRIETYNPALYTAQYVGWAPINPGTQADHFADVTGSGNEGWLADTAADLLANGNPHVLFLQFPGVDSAGHSSGFSPTAAGYLDAIEAADAHYGIVLDALASRPGYIDGSEEWLILTVTDHGGYLTSHHAPVAGHELEMQRTFYIATGPGVAVGADLGMPRVFDVAVTTMDYLGMDTSEMDLDGHVVLPEPATLALLAAGGLLVLRRRAR